MNFGLAFSYVFKDKEWFKKVIIPTLVGLIPILGQFVVTGWGLQAAKNVIDGKSEDALPNLDFGADLGRGFMAAVITAIYSLPAAIVFGLSSGLFAFTETADETMGIFLMILGGCLGLFGLLFAILAAFWGMVAVANYVAKGEFGAAFKFKEIFGLIKNSFGSWLLVVLGQIVAMGFIAPLGVIACGVGVFLTMTYGIAVYSHLLGQAYDKSAPPPLAAIDIP